MRSEPVWAQRLLIAYMLFALLWLLLFDFTGWQGPVM